jgi:hypothetical protein
MRPVAIKRGGKPCSLTLIVGMDPPQRRQVRSTTRKPVRVREAKLFLSAGLIVYGTRMQSLG